MLNFFMGNTGGNHLAILSSQRRDESRLYKSFDCRDAIHCISLFMFYFIAGLRLKIKALNKATKVPMGKISVMVIKKARNGFL